MTQKKSKTTPEPTSKLLVYLRLFRLPNVFTAMADVAMGFLFVRQSLEPVAMFVCLLAASSLFYTAGMVLNDVFDYDVDKRERPERPLPSGQISLRWASWLGFKMLLVGVGLAWLAGYIHAGDAQPVVAWRSGAVAVLLVTCVLLYDGGLKRTVVGPLAMGACRFFNVLLGMSLAAWVANDHIWTLYFDVSELLVAGGIGVYIVGVTWFARTEAKISSRWHLGLATGVMIVGITMLAMFNQFGLNESRITRDANTEIIWPTLLLVLVFTIARRCLKAVRNPTPQRVQDAVKQCIFSLIILDASVVLALGLPQYAIGVVALLVPTIVLGNYVYST
jgi:4-hydroxybenzoate polyprenyltransferase